MGCGGAGGDCFSAWAMTARRHAAATQLSRTGVFNRITNPMLSFIFLLIVVEAIDGVLIEISALVIIHDNHANVFVTGHVKKASRPCFLVVWLSGVWSFLIRYQTQRSILTSYHAGTDSNDEYKITPCNGRSALLLVGSIPSILTKVHSDRSH